MRTVCTTVTCILLYAIVSGCTPHTLPPPAPVIYQPPAGNPAITGVVLQSLPQTIGIEHQDRINRFRRLSDTAGIKPPQIDELQIAADKIPGYNYPVPVVRVVFDSKVFFDFDKDTIRPEASKILDVIAQSLKRDTPDTQLLLLGHTDAVGTDAYNVGLSQRRAYSVLRGLVDRGVNPYQLSTVAIGKSQPIAPNDTDDGRARNRRVEFIVSAVQQANVEIIRQRKIIREYLAVGPAAEPAPLAAMTVELLRPAAVQTATADAVSIQEPKGKAFDLKPAEAIQLEKPIPLSYAINKPTEFAPNQLRDGYVVE